MSDQFYYSRTSNVELHVDTSNDANTVTFRTAYRDQVMAIQVGVLIAQLVSWLSSRADSAPDHTVRHSKKV